MDRLLKDLKVLEGATIERVEVAPADCGWTPILFVRTRLGERLQVEAWQDAEGNGPGHLSVGPEVRDETVPCMGCGAPDDHDGSCQR